MGRANRPARPTVPCALVVTLALVAVACGGADGGSGASDESGGAPAPDRFAVPLGTDPAAVAPYVDELLSSYNASVNEIAATPTLAVEAGAPAVRTFVDLFEPGSGGGGGGGLLAEPGPRRRLDPAVHSGPAGLRHPRRDSRSLPASA